MKVLSVFGTRPEAIKMTPVVRALAADPYFDARVCVTAQHRQMLDQVLAIFHIQPDFDLDLMRSKQTPGDVIGEILHCMADIFARWRPDMVLVHGDTTTTLGTALAAYYAKIAVGHVEAGLRTGDKYAPWPEEMNRRLTAALADLHFAPTWQARENLLSEGITAERIYVTGNTVIDALLYMESRIQQDADMRDRLHAVFPFLDKRKSLILVTGHRRENFGAGLASICQAVGDIARRDDVQIVFPVHPNPHVREQVYQTLDHKDNIFLIEPQDYPEFVYLLKRCALVLTDSGGIQEEAPALGKPVYVMREQTERPEAIEAGAVHLVGTDRDVIVRAVGQQLDAIMAEHAAPKPVFPYGDGTAAQQIAHILKTVHAA